MSHPDDQAERQRRRAPEPEPEPELRPPNALATHEGPSAKLWMVLLLPLAFVGVFVNPWIFWIGLFVLCIAIGVVLAVEEL